MTGNQDSFAECVTLTNRCGHRLFFTRDSCTGRYCWERVLAMGILSVRLSVCPSRPGTDSRPEQGRGNRRVMTPRKLTWGSNIVCWPPSFFKPTMPLAVCGEEESWRGPVWLPQLRVNDCGTFDVLDWDRCQSDLSLSVCVSLCVVDACGQWRRRPHTSTTLP